MKTISQVRYERNLMESKMKTFTHIDSMAALFLVCSILSLPVVSSQAGVRGKFIKLYKIEL